MFRLGGGCEIRAFIEREPESFLGQLAGGTQGGEARYLSAALAQDDPSAKRILEETAEDLAFGLSHVAHLFHPEVVVLEAGFPSSASPRRAVAEALQGFVMEAFAPGPKVALAALGEDAVPVGALALAQQCLCA